MFEIEETQSLGVLEGGLKICGLNCMCDCLLSEIQKA